MQNNDNIIFIDAKGVSHNARVQSFREHRDGKNELVHDEPLVTLNYNNSATGEPVTLIDVPHMDHPSKQETNPELPTYALHAWKYEDEDHLQVPPDHPIHDHPNEQPKKDAKGKVIPKARPIYERHIRAHRQMFGLAGLEMPTPPVASSTESGINATEKTTRYQLHPMGHPGNPETLCFDFNCNACGKTVKRVASHQGGKQFESEPVDDNWVEHVCKQEDIEAHRALIAGQSKPKEPELTPSERLAAGEQIVPTPEPEQPKEPGVLAQLEADAKKQPPESTEGDQG